MSAFKFPEMSFDTVMTIINDKYHKYNHSKLHRICGNHIYSPDGCTNPNCNRDFHTISLSLIKLIINNNNFKKNYCLNDEHCNLFMCPNYHHFDHLIFGKHKFNNPTLFLSCSHIERNTALVNWKIMKNNAYSEELLNGRPPKNNTDILLLKCFNEPNNLKIRQEYENISNMPFPIPCSCNDF